MLYSVGSVSVASFLPLLHHRVFKDISLVYTRDKLHDFVVVGDLDVVLIGVVSPPSDVSSIGAEMLVGELLQGAMKAYFVAILLALVITGHVRR